MKKLATATALLLASSAMASAEGVLQLYNWGNYTSPELLAKFEAETGIKVTVTDYDSNDGALAKVEAGGSGFDGLFRAAAASFRGSPRWSGFGTITSSV